MYCFSRGKLVNEGIIFCSHCGARGPPGDAGGSDGAVAENEEQPLIRGNESVDQTLEPRKSRLKKTTIFSVIAVAAIIAVAATAGIFYYRSSATVIADIHSTTFGYTVSCSVYILGQPVQTISLNPEDFSGSHPVVLKYDWWGRDPVSITVGATVGTEGGFILDEKNVLVFPGGTYTLDLYI